MAHSLSAKKRIRQNLTRRFRNRARKHQLKSQTKKFLETVASGDANQAEQQFRVCVKMYDRIAAKGTIHRNAAARRKSWLAGKMNEMKAAAAQA